MCSQTKATTSRRMRNLEKKFSGVLQIWHFPNMALAWKPMETQVIVERMPNGNWKTLPISMIMNKT
jgi:hypothetical protein